MRPDSYLYHARPKGAPKVGTQPPAPKYPIESVDNALRLIALLGERPSVGVSDAAEFLGVAPSTAHRLLAMLQHHRFAHQDTQHKTYYAGPALVEAGLSVIRGLDIRSQARPEIERLVAEVGETAHLCILRDADVFFLDCVESHHALREGSRTGDVLPAHCTASGRALLAWFPDDRVLRLFPDEELDQPTPRSIKTRTALLAELATVRRQGYAVNVGESEPGLRAAAAAIVDDAGRLRGAITVAGPDGRMTAKDVPRIARAVADAATRVGKTLS